MHYTNSIALCSQYEKSKRDVKSLGELVFGTLVSSSRVGFKLHQLDDGGPDRQMWSTTFAPETLAKQQLQQQRSCGSFGSSVGSNLSAASFASVETSDGTLASNMDP